MELEHLMPISQMGTLRPGKAPSKAGAGPGLETGALLAAPTASHHHLTSSVLIFLFLVSPPPSSL